MSEQELSPALRARLALLAESEPPAELWQRITTARTRMLRRRRWRRGGVAAALAAVLLAFALLPSGPLPLAPATDPTLVLQQRSRHLETELRALEQTRDGTGAKALPDAPTRELQQLDRTLQAAYDHRAGSRELAPLWQQRNELLNTLIATQQPGVLLTRI